MSRQPNPSLNYAAVANACAELINRSETPTLKKLRGQLGGGSFSDIHPHYHRWQDEQRLAKKVNTEPSEALRQAVLAEIGRTTATLEKKSAENLEIEKERLRELKNLLLECETQTERLRADFEDKQRDFEQKCLKLEKELSIAAALVEDDAKRKKEYQRQIEALREEAKQAELKAAVSESKREEMEKQFNRLETKKADRM